MRRTGAPCEVGHLHAGRALELAADRVAVAFDRARGAMKGPGHLGRREPVADEREHLDLAARQQPQRAEVYQVAFDDLELLGIGGLVLALNGEHKKCRVVLVGLGQQADRALDLDAVPDVPEDDRRARFFDAREDAHALLGPG
jgi:hypothetical protein